MALRVAIVALLLKAVESSLGSGSSEGEKRQFTGVVSGIDLEVLDDGLWLIGVLEVFLVAHDFLGKLCLVSGQVGGKQHLVGELVSAEYTR